MTERDKSKFAIFILTHGRPNDQVTLETLKETGYTGKVYLIIDDEDKTADEYFEKYGDIVIQFNKAKAGELFDIADTRTDRRATVFARMQSFNIAKELGLDYFMQMDDDYNFFKYRWVEDGRIQSADIRSMDRVIEAMIDFLEDTGATSVAMSQGGDHIGGLYLKQHVPLLRKAMNTWLFRTDTEIEFLGRMNDDVNTYVVHGSRGRLFFTSTALHSNVVQTQAVAGGMTEMYLATGTYMKSMYTVMMHPSSVTVRSMGPANPRLHHSIRWDYTVPKIISDRHQKK